MKAVLLSIQPKWCELIANGKKTVDVRKTKPKLDTPFKVYIYCTKPKHFYRFSSIGYTSDEFLHLCKGKVSIGDGFEFWGEEEYEVLNGKVIGEFICNEITVAECGSYCDIPTEKTQIDVLDYLNYADGKTVYGWHISDLVIYNKPKEFREFRFYYPRAYFDREIGYPMPTHEIKRPPQNYYYVDELKGE